MASAFGATAGRAAERRRPSKLLSGGVRVVKWDSVKWENVSEDAGPQVQPCVLSSDDEGFYLYYDTPGDIIEVNKVVDVRIGVVPSLKDGRMLASLKTMAPEDTVAERVVCISLTNAKQRLSSVDLVDIYLILYSGDDARSLQKDIFHLMADPLHASPSVLTLLHKQYSYLMLSNAGKEEISVQDLASIFVEGQDDKVLYSLEALKLKPKNAGSDMKKSDLTFEQFYALYSHMCTRPEMVDVIRAVSGVKNVTLAASDFYDLLTDEKFHYDPRRNFILFPKQTRAETDALLEKYCQGKVKASQMSVAGLTRFLLSDDNLVVENNWYHLCDDMNHPLAHYFINSSHNTYLTGHQLSSKSQAQMYRIALLAGCRCLELDCWPDTENGEPEPYITHGMTMCTKIPFRDCIEAIAQTAFITSDFPVILSFENHCTTNILQEKMARYCRDIFGDLLLANPISGYPLEKNQQLPPPSMLKRKILIKNKKRAGPEPRKPSIVGLEERVTDTGDGEDDDDGKKAEERDGDDAAESTDCPQPEAMNTGAAVKDVDVVNTQLSSIVNYVQPVQFKTFYDAMERAHFFEMSSFSEDKGLNWVRDNPVEFVQYNINQMCRIYPRGTRVESGNYQPQAFWNCGAQMVALNIQTIDSPMQLNIGRFALNSNCGYLLKPRCFTTPPMKFDPFGSVHNGIIPHELSIRIISGQYLCKKKCAVSVEVDIIGVPPDVCLRKLRTRPSKDGNSTNPRWDFEIIKKKRIIVPEMATIRIAAVDDRRDLLGVRFLPVHLVQPGYRHIPLLNRLGRPAGLASLFVHIQVKDFVSEEHAMWVDALVNPLNFLAQQREEALADLNAGDELPRDEDASQPSERAPPTLVQGASSPIPSITTKPPSPGLVKFKAIGHLAVVAARSSRPPNSTPNLDEPSLVGTGTGLTLPRSRSNHETDRVGQGVPQRPTVPTVSVEDLRSHRDYVKFQRKQTKESQDADKKHRQEMLSKQKQKDESIAHLTKKLERKSANLLSAKEKAIKKVKSSDVQFHAQHFENEVTKLRKVHQAEVQQLNTAFSTTQAAILAKHRTDQGKIRKRFAMEEERVMVKVMKALQTMHRTERKALYERELKEARENMVSSAEPSTSSEGGDRGWQRRVTVAAVVSKIQTLKGEHDDDFQNLEKVQERDLSMLVSDLKRQYDALCTEDATHGPRRTHTASMTERQFPDLSECLAPRHMREERRSSIPSSVMLTSGVGNLALGEELEPGPGDEIPGVSRSLSADTSTVQLLSSPAEASKRMLTGKRTVL